MSERRPRRDPRARAVLPPAPPLSDAPPPGAAVDLTHARSVREILRDAALLYHRRALLFFVLALSVVAPYRLIVLAATGKAPLERPGGSALAGVIVLSLEVAITPLISALHVYAVRALGNGEDPQLKTVARQGIAVLPLVIVTELFATLGITAGVLALVLPGLYLALRWAVAAQAAAIERHGWRAALRRSGEISHHHLTHVLGVLLSAGLLTYVIALLMRHLVGAGASPPQVLAGIATYTITQGFGALTYALLYYDLLARHATTTPNRREPPPASPGPTARR